ncbi:RNA polymerase sigma factor [Catenulispora yoronensis]
MVLYYFDDMTHAQIAAALGLREATVRGQMSRAMARLRQDGLLAGFAGSAPAARSAPGAGSAQGARPVQGARPAPAKQLSGTPATSSGIASTGGKEAL